MTQPCPVSVMSMYPRLVEVVDAVRCVSAACEPREMAQQGN